MHHANVPPTAKNMSINFVLSSLLFNIVPTTFEISLVAYILASQFGWKHAGWVRLACVVVLKAQSLNGPAQLACPRSAFLFFLRLSGSLHPTLLTQTQRCIDNRVGLHHLHDSHLAMAHTIPQGKAG